MSLLGKVWMRSLASGLLYCAMFFIPQIESTHHEHRLNTENHRLNIENHALAELLATERARSTALETQLVAERRIYWNHRVASNERLTALQKQLHSANQEIRKMKEREATQTSTSPTQSQLDSPRSTSILIPEGVSIFLPRVHLVRTDPGTPASKPTRSSRHRMCARGKECHYGGHCVFAHSTSDPRHRLVERIDNGSTGFCAESRCI